MSLQFLLPAVSVLTAFPLAAYCLLLSRRLRKLNNLETGLGGAIAVMTSEISRLDQCIRKARAEAEAASNELARVIEASRNEKAYWALQSELSRGGTASQRRLRPRAQLLEAEDA
ncbi:hypothetical protein FQV27_12770 [Paracoccus aurantiacus]|uniref:Uncharacterized protein n=1 Tax=Paracoccus aurantiacus TaxID=2599412 RepID=A0A5C6S1F1_9RHOB|nr:hypothetical protein [Paracoccus aurantiacus]TXB68055.1 hypothetical protein FQV27_12770 [Paracoccus aurantiacus]